MNAEDLAEVRAMIDAEVAKVVATIDAKAAAAASKEMDSLTIQSGQNTTISGTGKNITIGFDPPTWTGTGLCDGEGGVTLTIKSN